MNRLEFLKICGILGVSLSLDNGILSSAIVATTNKKFNGKVIIIGAGAGGLSTGYLLHQLGIDFKIIEASSTYGGRMKINREFADFPIPLGAEWIETNKSIFQEIVNDDNQSIKINTFLDEADLKFENYSWLQFFKDYIVSGIADRISYDNIVSSVDYVGNEIVIKTQREQFIADKVVVSVPLKMLKEKKIKFLPEFPAYKIQAIQKSEIWGGFKAFIEFSERFYEDTHEFNISPVTDGEKLYYDATYGQQSSINILGLFVVGKPALDYTSKTEEDAISFILEELDSIYDNKASPNYRRHLIQNWNNEPFIGSAYMTDHADWKTVKKLGKSINQKVYFAGGAYTDGEDWVSVHAAARSAKRTVTEIIS